MHDNIHRSIQAHATEYRSLIANARSSARGPLDDFHAYWYLGARFQYTPFGQYVHTTFNSTTLNFNSRGYRGPEFDPQKRASMTRIAFFGSSAVLGVPNANDKQTIPELCRDELAHFGVQVEALNFSVMCSLIKNQYDTLLRALLEFNPDVVILYAGYNDVLRAYHGNIWKSYEDVETILNKGFDWNAHKETPSYHLRNAWAAVERKVESFWRPRSSDAYERLLQHRREKMLRKVELSSVYPQGRSLFKTVAMQAFDLARRARKPLVFTHQPALSATRKRKSLYERAYEQYEDLTFGPDPEQAESQRSRFGENYQRQRLESHALMGQLGAHVYDPEDQIALAGPDTDIFFDYAHLTVSGNQLVARGLAALLIEKGIVAEPRGSSSFATGS